MKILANILIVVGGLFTLGALFIIFTVRDWQDIIIGWFFLGPLPLILGIILNRNIAKKADLTLGEKLKK